MTDKQIIIDGVDVSGCDELVKQDDNTLICEITGYLCEDRQNCYYKQLQRKEQECKEKSWEIGNLGYKIKNQRKEINIRLEQLDQLKAENGELRKNLVDKHTSRCFRLVTHREFDKLIMETVQLRQENKKLKQTLTEIKEIAKNAEKRMYATKSNDYTEGYSWLGSIILQKISEVK